jgi:hypothetical protein
MSDTYPSRTLSCTHCPITLPSMWRPKTAYRLAGLPFEVAAFALALSSAFLVVHSGPFQLDRAVIALAITPVARSQVREELPAFEASRRRFLGSSGPSDWRSPVGK